jgi:serine/threonine protein kinase
MVVKEQQVGEYLLEEEIGRGTFGQVWRARHHAWSDQVVAVKIPTDPRYIADLQREGWAVHNLGHPNIVRAINFGPFADPPYFVMEYVPGESLRGVLRRRTRLEPSVALSIIMPVLRGLAHAHKNGFIHRDIKPENILIRKDAWDEKEGAGFDAAGVKITDFGLGHKAKSSDGSIVFTDDLQEKGNSVGTPRYMAPEQAEGGEIDGRADLYSCGVVLFEMLTGQLPVGTELPSQLRPEVPKFLDEAFQRSYARLGNRFPSADEFLSFLIENLNGSGVPQGNGEFLDTLTRRNLGVRIDGNRIIIGDNLAVSFQRTLRIPDDGNTYPLPPGLQRIPIHRVEDFVGKVPPEWNEHGGVFITLYQREAMWILFEGEEELPDAVKVAVGKVNAVTGGPWSETLDEDKRTSSIDVTPARVAGSPRLISMPFGRPPRPKVRPDTKRLHLILFGCFFCDPYDVWVKDDWHPYQETNKRVELHLNSKGWQDRLSAMPQFQLERHRRGDCSMFIRPRHDWRSFDQKLLLRIDGDEHHGETDAAKGIKRLTDEFLQGAYDERSPHGHSAYIRIVGIPHQPNCPPGRKPRHKDIEQWKRGANEWIEQLQRALASLFKHWGISAPIEVQGKRTLIEFDKTGQRRISLRPSAMRTPRCPEPGDIDKLCASQFTFAEVLKIIDVAKAIEAGVTLNAVMPTPVWHKNKVLQNGSSRLSTAGP